jgi:hypothetical protein
MGTFLLVVDVEEEDRTFALFWPADVMMVAFKRSCEERRTWGVSMGVCFLSLGAIACGCVINGLINCCFLLAEFVVVVVVVVGAIGVGEGEGARAGGLGLRSCKLLLSLDFLLLLFRDIDGPELFLCCAFFVLEPVRL